MVHIQEGEGQHAEMRSTRDQGARGDCFSRKRIQIPSELH